jgi:predicted protein tyrosine phosphatase
VPSLYVCPLSKLHETVAASSADHVLSVINMDTPVPPPPGISPERHRYVGVSDIVTPSRGMILPAQAHVRAVIDFARAWPRARPMVVHCYAGVSRSTASAFIIACALRPDAPEAAFAEAIRARSPTATPNPLFVAIADALLQRNGRMIDAVDSIGRGVDCYEGQPFALDLSADAP